jgi:hypothetical protein
MLVNGGDQTFPRTISERIIHEDNSNIFDDARDEGLNGSKGIKKEYLGFIDINGGSLNLTKVIKDIEDSVGFSSSRGSHQHCIFKKLVVRDRGVAIHARVGP